MTTYWVPLTGTQPHGLALDGRSGGPWAVFVEHAGDRDAVAGISGAWPGRVGGAVGAYLSRAPIPAEVVLIARLS